MTTRIDRIQIDYTLQFTMPFHFGTGVRVGIIDRTVLRDSKGYLYVPGSTIKGVLRERCEQLARFYGAEDTLQRRITSPHEAEAALTGLGNKLTIIARLFGSQTYPGRIFFDDARQVDTSLWDSSIGTDGRYKSLQVETTTQVRLDRLTRTAVPEALYTSEFGVRALKFKGCIRGWVECVPIDQAKADSPTYSLLLLLAGLYIIERMGANKSTGKGQCTCEILASTQIVLNDSVCILEAGWESWLDDLEMLALYTEED